MLSTVGRITALIATGTVAVVGPRLPQTASAITEEHLPAALTGLLELGLLAIASWALGCLTLGSLRGAPGRFGRALLPTALRTAVFTGVAGTVLVGPAHAADGGWPLDGLQLPDRPAVAAPETTAPRDHTATSAPTEILVQDGDTLWSFAREGLDDEVTDARVARETRRWYRANREAIGADPDLLRPGQRLRAPAATEEDR